MSDFDFITALSYAPIVIIWLAAGLCFASCIAPFLAPLIKYGSKVIRRWGHSQ